MRALVLILAGLPALLWLSVLLLPWRPWGVREVLDAEPRDLPGGGSDPGRAEDLRDVTALIPARNEAEVIGDVLPSVAAQGMGLAVILVDDGSTDGTAGLARAVMGRPLKLVRGAPLPEGWSGKLWALEQGRRLVETPLTLLLDADIVLSPGIVAAMRRSMRREGAAFLSLMAAPSMTGFWERLLMPPFVYFFKLLYPFRLANEPRSRVAAAAGGLILVETRLFEEIGGLASIRNALIDDCTLASRVKAAGYRTWMGLTHGARSVRPYRGLAAIWAMVSRTAFTQLRYSVGRLLLCTLAIVLLFAVPVAALALRDSLVRVFAAVALLAMTATYAPTLVFYGRSRLWAPALPAAALLFLAMTWTSAIRFFRGERSRWKGRVYGRAPAARSAPSPDPAAGGGVPPTEV
jgi:hopene-associated glycosyltransferase HpnB